MKKRLLFLLGALLLTTRCFAAQSDIIGPPGSGAFGTNVTILPNGNFVVTDPLFDKSGPTVADVGAVYLFSPAGVLLSTLTGSTANDQVGNNGVVVLSNGNFVVRSTLWDKPSPATANVGAVTWGSATTGFPGGAVVAVSAANSLVGSTANDFVGNGSVTALTNGNYVVSSPGWNNPSPATADVGAATWGNGTTGIVGVVSAANSLIGSTANDQVGNSGVTVLTNGNYVVRSSGWDNPSPAKVDVGAVTWGNGTTGIVGAVSAANSLVGSTASDSVGSNNVTALNNGNYVVSSPVWNNPSPATADVGAATWGDGTTGIVGAVSAANSLVGSTANDFVGNGSVAALTNGNYVVLSPGWNNPSPATVDVGAVTWGNGTTGIVGAVSAANSLVGSTASANVGNGGVAALTNGNYVVLSPSWNNPSPATADVGAATWGYGTTGIVGAVSAANSLVGSTPSDSVGINGVTVLTNGNYVVVSQNWDNPFPATADVGAATWGNGVTGVVGAVSAANSLIGSTSSDQVGFSGVTALTNGNYIVRSPNWDKPSPATANVGAVTWGNGATGIVGVVSAANSLVGSTANDNVGSTNVTALTNGNYVVSSSVWNNPSPATADVGAATWGIGTTGIVGVVSATNSLIGSTANDQVGFSGVTALTNGNYVVHGSTWDNGSVVDAGAATWGNGTTGIVGTVSPANSLVGSTANDFVGSVNSGSVTPLNNGHYIVFSGAWDNGSIVNAGAVTLGNGNGGTVGAVTATNSVLGTAAFFDPSLSFGIDTPREQLVVGRRNSNLVTRMTNGSGKLAFNSDLITVNENAGTLTVPVRRSGGSDGTVIATIASSNGTATAGSDYTALAATVLTFGPGVVEQPVNIPINLDAVANEPNETFFLTLAGAASALGTIKKTTVRIIEGGDLTDPGAPVIKAPALNAHIGVLPGAPITITGTVSDNKGISRVEVGLNNGPRSLATLTSVSGTTATWSIQLVPQTGLNTIQAEAFDTTGFDGIDAIRTFFCMRPLVIKSLGANGTFTTGFAPSSFQDVGKLCTVQATTPAGFIFDKWLISGGSNAEAADIGLTTAQLEQPKITFIFKESLVLTALFVPNPYATAGIAGVLNGFIHASATLPDRAPLGSDAGEDGTTVSLATEGSISVTLLASGAFTGKLNIDGLAAIPVTGAFDDEGKARFGATRDLVFSVPRPGKTSLLLAFSIDITGPVFSGITGTVTDANIALSDITASRAHYNGTTVIPTTLLRAGNANGIFNVLLTPASANLQPGGLTAVDFPEECSGIGTFTVTKTGAVSFTATLPEGTTFTSAGTLDQTNILHLFVPLYATRGFFSSSFIFDPSQTNTDVTSSNGLWLRPPLDDQHYPVGWPAALNIFGIGTKFSVPVGSSVLPGLSAIDSNGNANLTFSGGALTSALIKPVGITPADVVQKPLPNDPSFTLTIARSTGRFSGTLTHSDGTKPAFQGIILQKAGNNRGSGFFKTLTPAVKTYTGQSGSVQLISQ